MVASRPRADVGVAIQAAVVEALDYPADKWVHRYFPMRAKDFGWGLDRTERYTLIEISLFAGRSTATKKSLLRLLFRHLEAAVGLDPHDLEITIFETLTGNWGIRGRPSGRRIRSTTWLRSDPPPSAHRTVDFSDVPHVGRRPWPATPWATRFST